MGDVRTCETASVPLDRLTHLIDEGKRDNCRFMPRLRDEFLNGVNRFDKDGEAFFVAKQGDEIVGVCGLNQDPYLNTVYAGRVRHLYVLDRVRGQGVGRMLLAGVIEAARRNFHILTLTTENAIADKLYCSMGFAKHPALIHATHHLNLLQTHGKMFELVARQC